MNYFYRANPVFYVHFSTEHRNMPLDDALSFVARNFDMYLKGIRDPGYRPIGPPVPRPSMPAQPPPSRDVSSLLRSDTDEKKLSNDELALLIEKLKREKEQRTGAKSGELFCQKILS